MYYTTYVEKTGGGSTGGGKGGSTSGGGGKGSTGGSKGGSTSGKSSTSGGSSGGKVTVKKPADLAKQPPVTVIHPDGTAVVMNMQDFCYLPNASALNTVAYSQCVSRKKHDDDDVPGWVIALIVTIFVIIIAGVLAALLSD